MINLCVRQSLVKRQKTSFRTVTSFHHFGCVTAE
jgi:hypothetical protein